MPSRPVLCRVVASAAVACLALGSAARAQERGPVLLIQPGMLSADFVSASGERSSSTGFNVRFATLIPSRSRWLTLIVGASITPYGTNGLDGRGPNTPVLFAGNVFSLLQSRQTAGWLDVDAPLLVTYSYGGGGDHNRRVYGRDVVAEGALSFHVGRKVLGDLGPFFRRLRVYLLVDQTLTPNVDPASGKRDWFNPVAQYGITIPLGEAHDTR
jgi:hypothetical protein